MLATVADMLETSHRVVQGASLRVANLLSNYEEEMQRVWKLRAAGMRGHILVGV